MLENEAIPVLRDINFEWVRRLRDVWLDDSMHVPEINREAFEGVLASFGGTGTPLGRVMVGPAGSGKTHLLGALRAAIAGEGWFVLVDMTDVRDFWDTVLQGYLESLREELSDRRTQFQMLLQEILAYLANCGVNHPEVSPQHVSHCLSTGTLEDIVGLAQTLIGSAVAPLHPAQSREFQDVLRALLLLNAHDFEVSNLGHSWLLGLELSDSQRRDCGFTGQRRSQKHVVQGLSWLMSLTRPTLLALDQMDAIVSQHHAASQAGESEDQQAARAILHGIGNGLLGLHDTLQRTLTLLSCLTSTWEVLRAQTTEAVAARYDRNMLPLAMADGAHGRLMVEARLAAAFKRHRFRPPYPSWPFRPEAFEDAAGLRPPREILIDCATHRDQCVSSGAVRELVRFGAPREDDMESPAAERVAQRYAMLLDSVATDGLVRDDGEDERLGDLIANACVCVVREQPALQERDLVPEVDFPGQPGGVALHARLRIVDHQSERERHYCFRVLNRSSAVAFQNRLRLAMTASGISANMSFRKLVILRNVELPPGEKAQSQVRAFTAAGGKLLSLSPGELACLLVLEQLCREKPEGLDEWLRRARPASGLSFLRESGFVEDSRQLPAPRPAPARPTPAPAPAPRPAPAPPAPVARPQPAPYFPIPKVAPVAPAAPAAVSAPKPFIPPAPRRTDIGAAPAPTPPPAPPVEQVPGIVLGQRAGLGGSGPVTLRVPFLSRHVAILASPGAGKTVMLRRMVEEAALLQIPAIVIDSANHLARLADPWPQPPAGWRPEDAQKAARFLQEVDVRVFTPGLASGRPLDFAPLPDFTGLEGVERDQLVEMTVAALGPVIAPTQSATAQRRRGLLAAALKYFVKQGGSGLSSLIELLDALPPDASSGDSHAARLGADIANLLRAQLQSNLQWRPGGAQADPAELLGLGGPRTRISVISLTGLASVEARQSFINSLALALFGWIRRHRAPAGQLRGMLVFDEVRELLPTRQEPLCKESLLRLAPHGRKYGLAMVLSTQEPQTIEPHAVAACATHVYGKAASPPAIERIRTQMQARGGEAPDIPRLGPGSFYASLEGSPAPVRMGAPWSLTWHPGTPLPPEEVLARAQRS